jgi:hypothetical protein
VLENIKELSVNNLNDLKEKIDKQYRPDVDYFKSIIKDSNKIDKNLIYYQINIINYHWQFSRSCKKGDFLEAGKWAKRLMDEKVAYERAEIDEMLHADYLPKELKNTFAEKVASLFTEFQKAVDDGKQGDKGRAARSQGEARTRVLNDQLRKMNEDLKRWYHVQKASEELKEPMDNIPQEYKILVRNLADKEIALATALYKKVLKGYHQENGEPDAREHFEKACCWLKERPRDLKAADQKIQSREGSSHTYGEDDHIMKEWEEHARSHEYLLACLGRRDTFSAHGYLAEDMNKYMDYMDECVKNVFQGREKRNPREVDRWVEIFIATKEGFETCLRDHGWLGDTPMNAFQRTFHTMVEEESDKRGIFKITSEDRIGGGNHINEIDLNKGNITGLYNFKRDTKNWPFSEVVYTQLQLALKKAGKDPSQFDLKSWYGTHIVNEGTKSVAERFLPAGETERTFKAGSEEFDALARTPTAKSKFHLLAQHPEAFGDKKVTSITVKRIFERDGEQLSEEQIDINYTIGPKRVILDEIDQEISRIKPKDMRISRMTRIGDALIRSHRDHRPERVNKAIEQFKTIARDINNKIGSDYIPENLRDELAKTTLFLIKDFCNFPDKAVRNYGKDGSKGREARNLAEKRIKELNDQLKTLSETTSIYKQVHEIQAKFIEVLSESNKEEANREVEKVDNAFKQFLLDHYEQGNNRQTSKQIVEESYKLLKDIVKKD